MKKILIASLVGGIILFIWQALSWTVLPTHLRTFLYTPAQDSILKALENSGIPNGAYVMPSADSRNATAFDSEYQKRSHEIMEKCVGKPMATIFYVHSMPGMEGSQFLFGFLYDFIAMLCACLLLALAYQSSASFMMRWWMVMLFSIVYIMQGPLAGNNWMMEPWHYTRGFVADGLIGWGLSGLWIAYYLKKK